MDVSVVVGRVGKPHGVRGEVTVVPRTDEPDRRFVVGTRLRVEATREAAGRELEIAAVRWHQERLLVRFEGSTSRESAETLRGRELHASVDASESPEDPEEFYDHQLVGLRVETTAGEPVGEVRRVDHHGAQDLLVIATEGGRELLFPFVTALVPQVDLAGGRLVVDDGPGLLRPETWDG